MPLIKDAELLYRHLRTAIEGKEHRVLVASDHAGYELLQQVLGALLSYGVPAVHINYGSLQVILAVRGVSLVVSWLTVPTGVITSDGFRGLVAGVGCECLSYEGEPRTSVAPVNAVFLIPGPGRDVAELETFVAGILSGQIACVSGRDGVKTPKQRAADRKRRNGG